jgi:hypothetical protein
MTKTDISLNVFAKTPIPGSAKTRLIPALGAEDAAELHARLVHHTLQNAIAANIGPVTLWCAPDSQHPFFAECIKKYGVTVQTQQGDDLGQRMAHALQNSLHTCKHALLIGTDCPWLSPHILQTAASLVEQGSPLFIPAEDGGYVLVGATDCVPPIFDQVHWGSDKVMQQTRMHLRQHGLNWREMPSMADIDRPADLDRLQIWFPDLLNGLLNGMPTKNTITL